MIQSASIETKLQEKSQCCGAGSQMIELENNKFLHVFVVLVKIKCLDFFLEIKISKQYIKF